MLVQHSQALPAELLITARREPKLEPISQQSRTYAIHSDEESRRLELQARLARIEDHLKYVDLPAHGRILDAGCGPGSMARLIARAQPGARVTGIDQRDSYLEMARANAAKENLDNVEFQQADVFDLPFADGSFDVVWTKYLLQWLKEPKLALAELKRVTKPGGLVVSCDFADFMIEHFPVDAEFESQIRAVMPGLVDPNVGRKIAGYMISLGFKQVAVDIEADRVFTVIGKIDAERRWNWEKQWAAARPEVAKILGSEDEAAKFLLRCFAHFDAPETCTFTSLYFTRGRVPT
jgi:ubiquinone/menaquinone biosynthesis C-methylase UbiE